MLQGITEWLPVSSSGHLILAETLLNYHSDLTFNTALHFGTLMSVFVYFGKDITDILQDFLKLKFHTQNARLGILIILATIPAAIIGFFFKNIFESIFSNLTITALGFGITGLLLIITSLSIKIRHSRINAKNSIIIGLAQVLSIFPGISRSGATISTGILSGLNEKTAMKFSFLLSIPIIFGANILTIANQKLPTELIWATLTSFVTGLITLHLLYKFILTKKSLLYFGSYALLLSLLIVLYLII